MGGAGLEAGAPKFQEFTEKREQDEVVGARPQQQLIYAISKVLKESPQLCAVAVARNNLTRIRDSVQ